MAYIYRDTPVGIHRLNKMPYDDTEIFNNIPDLFYYINNGAAYEGQKCIVKLPYYEQDIILKKGRGSKLVPVFDIPTGMEWITKTYNDRLYAMIYYNNGGSPFSNINEQVRLTDSFAWSLLPHAGLIAGSDTSITYLLETYSESEGEKAYTFTQANFCTQPVSVPSGSAVNGIGSTENAHAYFPTPNSGVMIMPKARTSLIVRLWVNCADFDAALGV